MTTTGHFTGTVMGNERKIDLSSVKEGTGEDLGKK